MYKISSRLDGNCFTYAASRFEKHGFEKKNRHSHQFKKKKTKKIFIYFKLCTVKDFGQISFKQNFLLRKISKEAPNLQPATVVLFLKAVF